MHEITYWVIFLIIFLLALPLIFFIGVMASGLILIAIIIASVFWNLNIQIIEIQDILLILTLFFFSLFVIYFVCLLIFATFGFLIYKFKNEKFNSQLKKQADCKEEKSLKFFANVFYLTLKSQIKKIKWLILGILPIIVIAAFLTHQEFNRNEFWI